MGPVRTVTNFRVLHFPTVQTHTDFRLLFTVLNLVNEVLRRTTDSGFATPVKTPLKDAIPARTQRDPFLFPFKRHVY